MKKTIAEVNIPGMTSEEGTSYYKIEYYNNVFKQDYSIKVTDFADASNQAKMIKRMVEMRNVKLYEVKEIDFD